MFGPDAQRYLGAGGRADASRDGFRSCCELQRPICDDAGREQVHRRRTDEPGDEQIGRVLIELHRRPDLLDAARVEDNDAVGQRHRLDLVVCHVDHGGAQLGMQTGDLQPHLHAQRRVEVRKRLVEQEHLGIANDGTADRHALPLPPRKLLGPAVQKVLDLQNVGNFVDALGDQLTRLVGQPHAEADVLPHVHVREQRVGLEHHGDAALRRRRIGNVLAADDDLPGRDALEPGDHAQQRGLAASGRADEDHELAGFDGKVDALDDFEGAERLADGVEGEVGHLLSISL